jgi:hypothetical protein
MTTLKDLIKRASPVEELAEGAEDIIGKGSVKQRVGASIKAHPLKWGAGALGVAGATGFAAGRTSTGNDNQ